MARNQNCPRYLRRGSAAAKEPGVLECQWGRPMIRGKPHLLRDGICEAFHQKSHLILKVKAPALWRRSGLPLVTSLGGGSIRKINAKKVLRKLQSRRRRSAPTPVGARASPRTVRLGAATSVQQVTQKPRYRRAWPRGARRAVQTRDLESVRPSTTAQTSLPRKSFTRFKNSSPHAGGDGQARSSCCGRTARQQVLTRRLT
jgi:hypothetical protein